MNHNSFAHQYRKHNAKVKVDDVCKHDNDIRADGKVMLFKCPNCDNDNMAAEISNGVCWWCKWSAYR